jgi:hypothetical protein
VGELRRGLYGIYTLDIFCGTGDHRSAHNERGAWDFAPSLPSDNQTGRTTLEVGVAEVTFA